jgi:hypothetical protein
MSQNARVLDKFGEIAEAITMGRLFISLFFTGWVLTAMPVQAADDAYLNMLADEAKDLQLDQSGQLAKKKEKKKSVKKAFTWNGELQQETIPAGLAMEQFEAFLQENFYGTYAFFNKLNTTDKNTVYYRYSQAEKPDLEFVRQNVMALLKQ